jgi:hypothetical protein
MSLSVKAARMRGGAMPSAMMRQRYGDPGLFGFLGKVGKAALGGAVGLATGGLQGAISGAVTPFVGSRPAASVPQGPGRPPALNLPMVAPRGAGFTTPVGRVSMFEKPSSNGVGTKLACPSGFHANKADYFLRDGTFVPAGTKCVKNRRRNPMNVRALRSSVARIDSAKIWQGKLRGIETDKYTKAGNKKDC